MRYLTRAVHALHRALTDMLDKAALALLPLTV